MWLDTFNEMRKNSGMSLDELSAKSTVPKGTLAKISSGITKSPPLETMRKLVYAMGYSLDDLDRGLEISDGFSKKEKNHIKKYRSLDPYGKEAVDSILEIECKRCMAAKVSPPAENTAPLPVYIKHYLVPAAAGYASPIEGEDYEEIPLPPGAPANADYCITVSGDSMAPYIKDGELVYVKQGAPLREFEPGIFFVDGDVFCKQWCPGYAGEIYLLSANPKREDANITIWKDSGRNCVYFGKVLLDKKLPQPSYI